MAQKHQKPTHKRQFNLVQVQKATIWGYCLTKHFEHVSDSIPKRLRHRTRDRNPPNLYVDNIMMIANSVEEALKKCKASKKLFAQIGMNLRKYISNSEAVNAQITVKDSLNNGPLKLLGVL